ncbi:hypothetical protein BJY00DRAFT_271093 [Aspergillus carlsbadensis]|nr:hypothetical protein BJY00DRAFT_271093 [Aspergillus carlsbadensis]
MPIYFQEGITFSDPSYAESIVRTAFQGTTLEEIYDGYDETKEVWIWNDWHTSSDPNQHLTVKVFEDRDGSWMTTFYHVYANGSYRFMGEESVSSLAERLGMFLLILLLPPLPSWGLGVGIWRRANRFVERYNTSNWGWETRHD